MATELTRGRVLLVALLQRTAATHVAARCRVYKQRVSDWACGYTSPCATSRRMLECNYGLPADAWDQPMYPVGKRSRRCA